MSKFLDYHPSLPLMSPDAVQAMIEQVQEGPRHNSAVSAWNIFVGITGQAWCLCEAPDIEDVLLAHETVGFIQDLNNIVEVTQLV